MAGIDPLEILVSSKLVTLFQLLVCSGIVTGFSINFTSVAATLGLVFFHLKKNVFSISPEIGFWFGNSSI